MFLKINRDNLLCNINWLVFVLQTEVKISAKLYFNCCLPSFRASDI